MSAAPSRQVEVAALERVANRVKRFEFVPCDGQPLPVFSPGAHVVVTMREGDRVFRNPYSLMGSPFATDRYQISVLRALESRGGSAFMHEKVTEGTKLEISQPVNLFPIVGLGRKHLLIAGGIGITPFLAMMEQLKATGGTFELHYAVRSAKEGAYFDRLTGLPGVDIYRDDNGERIPLAEILGNQPLGTHLYVCGPQGMIDWTLNTARDEGWPEDNVHYEHFAAPPPGEPFLVKLAKSGREIKIGAHQSMLEALEQAGVDAPYLCRGGACGQCLVRVVNADGALLHNDHVLNEDERREGKLIATCVSRSTGCLTLDL